MPAILKSRVGERKNIFLIGRCGHKGDENQLTEMLAFLFQQEPELVAPSLASLGLKVERLAGWEVATRLVVANPRRHTRFDSLFNRC